MEIRRYRTAVLFYRFANIESYIANLVNEFAKEEAERENCTVVWADFRHQHLPVTLQYRKVEIRWSQDNVHYGPRIRVGQKEVKAYSTKVDQRKTRTKTTLTVQRDVTHTNEFTVWSLDAKEVVSEHMFTAGLKGIIETKMYSEESYAHEVETTIEIKQTEKLSVRADVPLSARSVTKISWIITEDEAEMKWTVSTYITGYFAICLRDSANKEEIVVFSVAALSAVDYRLDIIGSNEIMLVSHGTIKSIKATGSYIRVNETFLNQRKQLRSSVAKIRTGIIR